MVYLLIGRHASHLVIFYIRISPAEVPFRLRAAAGMHAPTEVFVSDLFYYLILCGLNFLNI
jgi:hypothetical protein